MHRTAATFVLLVLTLSGCGDRPPVEDGLSADEVEAIADGVGVEATPTTGVVRCVTVDQRLVPLAGAQVRIEPGRAGMLSDASGGCGFEGLDAGTYFLEASKDGYLAARAPVTVEAGVAEPPVVRLVLEFVGKMDAYVDYHRFGLHLGASVSIQDNIWLQASELDYFKIDVQRGLYWPTAEWIQSEMVWEPATFLAQNLQLDCRIFAETTMDNITYGQSMLPNTIEPVGLSFKHDTYTCRANAADMELLPVGFAFEQDVEVITSVFYGFKPASRWFFTLDGEHPPP